MDDITPSENLDPAKKFLQAVPIVKDSFQVLYRSPSEFFVCSTKEIPDTVQYEELREKVKQMDNGKLAPAEHLAKFELVAQNSRERDVEILERIDHGGKRLYVFKLCNDENLYRSYKSHAEPIKDEKGKGNFWGRLYEERQNDVLTDTPQMARKERYTLRDMGILKKRYPTIITAKEGNSVLVESKDDAYASCMTEADAKASKAVDYMGKADHQLAPPEHDRELRQLATLGKAYFEQHIVEAYEIDDLDGEVIWIITFDNNEYMFRVRQDCAKHVAEKLGVP